MQSYSTRDPRRGNQPGDYGQMAPYRDSEEDDTQANVMAQAIAPQGRAPQPQQQQAPPDVSQPQRAALQQPQGRTGLAGRMGSDGSLSSMTGGNTGVNGGAPYRDQARQQLQQQNTGGLSSIPNDFPQGLPRLQPDGSYSAPTQPRIEAAPQAPAAPAASPSSWNTDGYAAPASVAQNVRGQAPAGWDQTKWDNQDHQTPKYVWGRITQDDNPDDIAQLLAAYPGAQFDGKDKVSGIPGLGKIDVYQGASTGANVPQWLDLDAQAAEGQGADPMAAALGYNPQEEQYAQTLGIDTSNPLWRQILEQLQAEALGGQQGNLSGDEYYRQF